MLALPIFFAAVGLFPAADLSLDVVNPGLSISPGIHLPCYGPYVPPRGALALRKLMPKVNMEIVHHMIMFGGRGAPSPGTRPGTTHLCYQGSIMYAWARTGQTTPIGLDFADTELEGHLIRSAFLSRGPTLTPTVGGTTLGIPTVQPWRNRRCKQHEKWGTQASD